MKNKILDDWQLGYEAALDDVIAGIDSAKYCLHCQIEECKPKTCKAATQFVDEAVIAFINSLKENC